MVIVSPGADTVWGMPFSGITQPWNFSTGGGDLDATCPAVRSDGAVVYVTDPIASKVIALPQGFDTPKGSLWDLALAGEGAIGSPAPWGQRVFVSKGTVLYCVEPVQRKPGLKIGPSQLVGQVAWSADLNDPIPEDSAPAISLETENAVIVAGRGGAIAKYRADPVLLPGEPRQMWETSIPDSIEAAVALGAGGSVYVVANNGLYARNAADGSQKWSSSHFPLLKLPPGDHHVTAPAVALRDNVDRVYFTMGTHLYAVSGASGDEVWSASLPAVATTPVVVTPQEVVYVAVGAGEAARLMAVTSSTVLWSIPLPGSAKHLAVDQKGSVWIVTQNQLLRTN